MATDLQVTKTDGTATVVPGTLDTYTITVTNNGPDTVGSLTLTDPLPAGAQNATFGTPSQGSYDPGTGVWSGLTLASGGSVSMTLGVTINPSATGSFSNTVTVAPPAGVTDTNPANNSATDTDVIPAADLEHHRRRQDECRAGHQRHLHDHGHQQRAGHSQQRHPG